LSGAFCRNSLTTKGLLSYRAARAASGRKSEGMDGEDLCRRCTAAAGARLVYFSSWPGQLRQNVARIGQQETFRTSWAFVGWWRTTARRTLPSCSTVSLFGPRGWHHLRRLPGTAWPRSLPAERVEASPAGLSHSRLAVDEWMRNGPIAGCGEPCSTLLEAIRMPLTTSYRTVRQQPLIG